MRGTRSEIFPRLHPDFLIVSRKNLVDVRPADAAGDERVAHPAEQTLDPFVDFSLVQLQGARDLRHPPRVPESHPQNDLILGVCVGSGQGVAMVLENPRART